MFSPCNFGSFNFNSISAQEEYWNPHCFLWVSKLDLQLQPRKRKLSISMQRFWKIGSKSCRQTKAQFTSNLLVLEIIDSGNRNHQTINGKISTGEGNYFIEANFDESKAKFVESKLKWQTRQNSNSNLGWNSNVKQQNDTIQPNISFT